MDGPSEQQQATSIVMPHASKPTSLFFDVPSTIQPASLAILHLKRDSLLPVVLHRSGDEGYAEGAVVNTRFGSYPHSTILGLPWGSQVRASKVDTGSRGRRGKKGPKTNGTVEPGVPGEVENHSAPALTNKRKANETDSGASTPPLTKRPRPDDTVNDSEVPAIFQAAVEANSGFTHVLPPTPESWTSCLDHRTQIVYTPDYSYILQRMKVRPGDTIIEAGAGSGSFTHAAARAVFNGYPTSDLNSDRDLPTNVFGRVCSFEYHEPRVRILERELAEQHLDTIVRLTHRDVCTDGFVFDTTKPSSPCANAIFLDLPAPWLALRHLTRDGLNSPLNPRMPVHLCSFSPCIEQVMATVTHLRKTGWTEIGMAEMVHRRLDVRREHVGLRHEGLRGVNASPATVGEAVGRLRDVEAKLLEFHANKARPEEDRTRIPSRQERLEQIRRDAAGRKPFREGLLVHRTEPEIKTHTSYLVFAILPQQWSDEDELRCEERWPIGAKVAEKGKGKAKGDAGNRG